MSQPERVRFRLMYLCSTAKDLGCEVCSRTIRWVHADTNPTPARLRISSSPTKLQVNIMLPVFVSKATRYGTINQNITKISSRCIADRVVCAEHKAFARNMGEGRDDAVFFTGDTSMQTNRRPRFLSFLLGAIMPIPGTRALTRQIVLENGEEGRARLTGYFAFGHLLVSYGLILAAGWAIYMMMHGPH